MNKGTHDNNQGNQPTKPIHQDSGSCTSLMLSGGCKSLVLRLLLGRAIRFNHLDGRTVFKPRSMHSRGLHCQTIGQAWWDVWSYFLNRFWFCLLARQDV